MEKTFLEELKNEEMKHQHHIEHLERLFADENWVLGAKDISDELDPLKANLRDAEENLLKCLRESLEKIQKRIRELEDL